MKPARILLLAVALVAGLLAAFLVMRGNNSTPRTVVTEVTTPEERTEVLVATRAIGLGERLSATNVEWMEWPEGAVRPEYVTISAMPDAPQQLTGAVARFEFFPGEPIREQKLVRSEQGYLSAVLAEGMRGVSVPVAPASSAGGFIVPNDRVDVVLTRSSPNGRISEVVLANVRVLAIGARLGEVGVSGSADEEDEDATSTAGPQAQVFRSNTIATLELSPNQAQTIINADSMGSLSLTLRSIVDFNEDPTLVARQSTNQPVRLIRFGRETSVLSGQAQNDQGAAFEDPLPALLDPVPVEFTETAPDEQAPPPAPIVQVQ
jgi:pilus assembly protein CpaB